MVKKVKITEKELDEILKELPTYWKNGGEKRYVEDAYRYFMAHDELMLSAEGKKVYQYLSDRVVYLWCKETNNTDEAWMKNFINTLFSSQIARTPGFAERGRSHAEYLMKLFKSNPKAAENLYGNQD